MKSECEEAAEVFSLTEAEAVPGTFCRIEKVWSGVSVVQIAFTFETELTRCPGDMYALVCGPLLYALPIAEKWEKWEYVKDEVERKYPYCDYQITPQSDWNYAFTDQKFTVHFQDLSDVPFDPGHPPVQITANMVQIPWEAENGICEAYPKDVRAIGAVEEKYLQPYGSTNLRMTEMPLADV